MPTIRSHRAFNVAGEHQRERQKQTFTALIPIGPFLTRILAEHQQTSTSVDGFVIVGVVGRPLNTSGPENHIRTEIRPVLEQHGYTWRKPYGGRHGSISETNRHTNGNAQIAAVLFGRTPKVEVTCRVFRGTSVTRRS